MKSRPWQMDPEVEILRAEIARMRPVFKAAMAWHKAWSNEYKRQSAYRVVAQLGLACARAARKGK